MCNKPCLTCTELYCPWRKGWWELAEERADRELASGHFKVFATVRELIDDLHGGK